MSDLIQELEDALLNWDDAYVSAISDLQNSGLERVTEEKIRVRARNIMRMNGQTLPEVVRWKLRMAVGYRSEEE